MCHTFTAYKNANNKRPWGGDIAKQPLIFKPNNVFLAMHLCVVVKSTVQGLGVQHPIGIHGVLWRSFIIGPRDFKL